MAFGATEELARLRLVAVRQSPAAGRDPTSRHAQDALRHFAGRHVEESGLGRFQPVGNTANRPVQMSLRTAGDHR